jgi:hypothetical protein
VSRLWRGVRPWCAIVLAVGALAGCGGEAEPSGPQVRLLLSRDFGREVLDDQRLPLEDHGTAVKLLREDHDVSLDQFDNVKSVDGRRASFDSSALETSTRWNFFVNGVKNPAPPSKLTLLEDDVVQLDFEDVIGSEDMRGGVGVFPQPFRGGMAGWHFPVKVVCAEGFDVACRRVRSAFRAEGVDISGNPPTNPPATPRERRARHLVGPMLSARVFVGPWNELREQEIRRRVALGPTYSGVFADFSSDGRAVRLLDPHSEPGPALGAGTGLVAMTQPSQRGFAWLITGTDRKGVERAADAIDPKTLDNALQIAITDNGIENLPLSLPTDDS